MNWAELCRDRALADLPYKIELDGRGKILMSPATKKHSKYRSRIQRLLIQLMPQGDPLPECAIETDDGTRVADVAWISEARWASMRSDEASCSIAPEICVEILSPANTINEMLGTPERPGMRELYFRAGAQEFWVCDEDGRLSFHAPDRLLPRSVLCPSFPDRI